MGQHRVCHRQLHLAQGPGDLRGWLGTRDLADDVILRVGYDWVRKVGDGQLQDGHLHHDGDTRSGRKPASLQDTKFV